MTNTTKEILQAVKNNLTREHVLIVQIALHVVFKFKQENPERFRELFGSYGEELINKARDI